MSRFTTFGVSNVNHDDAGVAAAQELIHREATRMEADRESAKISEWFERHPGVLCGLCETEKATTFLEVWRTPLGPRGLQIDWAAEYPGTPVCETCLPALLDVPNSPWPKDDQH